ncbi:phospho-N-acetylmuramoyl-pentapeptide-transferase [Ruminococcaceae bacterium OttesenSCG-928-L11]|nr:phospho-N-acetylmuramoyl-pentapeptide-transferase [Ruminococcaceae bacterium OttesenSCG-928-L11]
MKDMPMLAAAAIACVLTALSGLWVVPMLRRLKYGQTILDIGPNWHKKKEGIPTMGGLMFGFGITAAVVVGYFMVQGGGFYSMTHLESMRVILGIVMTLAFASIGFLDDYIKVVKKRNLGLTARQKLIGQFAVSGLYVLGLYMAGDTSTTVFLPFLGTLNLGIFYYPLVILGISYVVNVVNFTDGVDGLCTSVTFVVSLGFLAVSALLQSPGMNMFAAAVAGGCVGFLIWNFHPAKIFMGDTGSFFLGGCVVAMAFGLGIPVYLVLMGAVYIIEGLTVIIQTTYFKLTRKLTGTPKRLFKMTPIHHHFEMVGWSEGKICTIFSLVQAVFTLLAVFAVSRM